MPAKFPDRPMTRNAPNNTPTRSPPGRGHLSDEVRKNLDQFTDQRSEIERIANSK